MGFEYDLRYHCDVNFCGYSDKFGIWIDIYALIFFNIFSLFLCMSVLLVWSISL